VKPPASRDPGVDRTQGVAELREGRVEVLRRTVLTPFRHDCEEDAEEHGGRDRARASAARTTVRDGRRCRSHPPRGHEPEYKRGDENGRAPCPGGAARAAPKRPSGRRPPAPRRAETGTALAGRAGAPKCPARLAAKAERTGPGHRSARPRPSQNGGPENPAPGTPKPLPRPERAGAPPTNFGKSGSAYRNVEGRRWGYPEPVWCGPVFLDCGVMPPVLEGGWPGGPPPAAPFRGTQFTV